MEMSFEKVKTERNRSENHGLLVRPVASKVIIRNPFVGLTTLVSRPSSLSIHIYIVDWCSVERELSDNKRYHALLFRPPLFLVGEY